MYQKLPDRCGTICARHGTNEHELFFIPSTEPIDHMHAVPYRNIHSSENESRCGMPRHAQCIPRHRTYRQISNISRTKSQYLNVSRLVLQLSSPNPLKPGARVENEDAVGVAPTGDAPTTSEWSTILLTTKVILILEVSVFCCNLVPNEYTQVRLSRFPFSVKQPIRIRVNT